MDHKSPNDTRYPTIAVLAGLIVAGIVALPIYVPRIGEPAQDVLSWLALIPAVSGFLVASALKIADQWERAVVLRMGKYRGLRGPGLFFLIPFIDRIAYHIDQRIRTTDFAAESCLTNDTVPVNVDAIAFWVVYDAERGCARSPELLRGCRTGRPNRTARRHWQARPG